MGKDTKDNRGEWRGTSPSTEFLRKQVVDISYLLYDIILYHLLIIESLREISI